MKEVCDGVAVVEISGESLRNQRILEEVRRSMVSRLSKTSSAAEKLSQASKPLNSASREDRFGISRNENDLDYERDLLRQNNKLKLEDEVRELERKELERLTEGISQLQSIFAKAHQVTVEQGTVIDRIDSNIIVVLEKIESGNIHLIRAVEHQENSMADYLIKMLGVVVICMTILLFFKFY